MERKSHVAAPGEAERLPPLNALRAFEAVARRGSFAAAAVDLHVTHWAVGKQVRLLEDWFGRPLFERRARGVLLTDEGSALLAEVAPAFERLALGATRLRRARPPRGPSGVVRVNVLASFALCWLLPRLAAFEAQHPNVEVQVSTTSRKLRYVGDAFDVGVRSGPDESAGLVTRPLMPDLRLPACSPELLRRLPLREAGELRQHTLLHSTSTRGSWAQWLREAGVPQLVPARHVELDHVFLQLTAAVEGLGVALLSLPLIQRDIAAGRLVCPLSAPSWRAPDYVLAVNAERATDPAVQAFRRWLVAAARRG